MSLAALLLVASATADVPPRDPWTRPFAIDAHLATPMAPYGVLGASVEWTARPWLAFSAGAGWRGDTVGGGLVHLRAGDDRLRVGLGSGLSIGGLRDNAPSCGLDCPTEGEFGAQRLATAWNAVNQLTLELRSGAGFHAAFGVGWSHLLNRARDWQCVDQCSPWTPKRDALYVDLSFGWAI